MVQITEHADGLGYIVLYGMTDRRHVTYEEARALIVRHGLNAELSMPTPRRAYARTVAANKPSKGLAIDVSTSAAQKVTKLIRAEKESGTEKVELADEQRLAFDRPTNTILVESENKDKIEADFQHFGTHVTADDIRSLARSVIERLDGVSLRGSADVQDAGGTYFVPIQHREQLQALGNVLEGLGVAYLRAFGVIRGPAEQFQVALQAEISIDRQVNDIARLVSKLTKQADRAVSYKKQLERFLTLLKDYSALTGQPISSEIQSRIQRAIAVADSKIAELRQKPRESKRSRTPK